MTNVTPIVIGISGASGSGKTLFANNLHQRLSESYDVVIIREDNYYRDQSNLTLEEREKANYDHPDALEHELLAAHLDELKRGREVAGPNYLFHTHTRAPESRPIQPAQVMICDGILLLADEDLRKRFDIKAFVDTPLDVCLVRRLKRDLEERGRSIAKTLDQYISTVRPMYWEFIDPSKKHAEHLVAGGGNNWKAIDLVVAETIKKISKDI